MGWPRKNDEMRLYKDKDGSYIVVLTANGLGHGGSYDAIANTFKGSSPSLASTGVSPQYLHTIRRVEWSDLPLEWRGAITNYMTQGEEKFDPQTIRGFWRIHK